MAMRARVAFAVLGLTLSLWLGTATSALADTWCDTDPPVQIITPAGNSVTVFVSSSGSSTYAAQLAHATISATVQPVQGSSATRVRLTVLVDGSNGSFPVTSGAWTNPGRMGTLLDSESGAAGTTLTLQFVLDVP